VVEIRTIMTSSNFKARKSKMLNSALPAALLGRSPSHLDGLLGDIDAETLKPGSSL
jgi:hypothetical protein